MTKVGRLIHTSNQTRFARNGHGHGEAGKCSGVRFPGGGIVRTTSGKYRGQTATIESKVHQRMVDFPSTGLQEFPARG